jgi:two-component system CheB/CheR fusion protein
MNNLFHVVALGASGVGISALLEFFETLPANTGAAYIAITHQKKDRISYFANMIDKVTPMPVMKATRTTRLVPNHVYVISEGTYLTVKNGLLVVNKRPNTNINQAIDVLFCSLAADFRSKAIGIIFWGLGTDGIDGINAIEKENGYVIVQQPDDSRDSEMAQRAVDQDHPNVVTTVPEIGEYLLAHMNVYH